MLQEAADLAIEYINAVLGEGKEYFGLKVSGPQYGKSTVFGYSLSSSLSFNDHCYQNYHYCYHDQPLHYGKCVFIIVIIQS